MRILQFGIQLANLTNTSKQAITNLTIIAEELIKYAKDVVSLIENWAATVRLFIQTLFLFHF